MKLDLGAESNFQAPKNAVHPENFQVVVCTGYGACSFQVITKILLALPYTLLQLRPL